MSTPAQKFDPLGGGLSFDLGDMELDLPPSSSVARHDSSAPGSLGDPFRIVGTAVQGTFLVEKVVAHGGFGVVYRAKHLKFSAPVALKCLKIPATLTEEERQLFLSRFMKEGEVMFRLSGSIPEVVRPLQVDSFGLPDGRLVPFIAFEWLDGETLKDLIVRRLTDRQPALGVQRAVEVLSSVARALHRAHRVQSPEGELCILHCDLKPDNIFVVNGDGGQTIKIFDFGIAKVRSAATREAGRATAETQGNMFTPAYAAPEQWAPDKYGQTGPWTDVFGMALTVAEFSAQRPAIDGPPATMLSLCLDETKRPTPRRLGVDTSDEVDAVFRKALAVAPTQRHRSMEAFWSDLERALGLAPSMAHQRSSMAGPVIIPDVFAQPAQAAPLAGSARPEASAPEFAGDLDFGLDPRPSVLPNQPKVAPVPIPIQPKAPEEGGGQSPAGLDVSDGFGNALDLAAGPASVSSFANVAPAAPSAPVHAPIGHMQSFEQSAGWPQAPASFGGHAAPAEAPGVPASVRAAERAAAAAAAARSAALAAKSIAGKALGVDEHHEIRFDEPSTWLKPMMPAIVVMALALLSTVVVVIINKATGSNVSVIWFSLPLMLLAVGFGAYRWMKLTRG